MNFQTLLNIHGRMDWRKLSPQQMVAGLCFDSRQITPGDVYIAIRGHSSDGHDFIDQVIKQGALALVVEDGSQVPSGFQGAVLEVLDTRLSLQVLSQRFFENPGAQMTSIAVTGTNGKTSSAYIIEHLLNSLNKKCGVIGTIDHHLGKKVWPTDLTSPDPITLQHRLKSFLNEGAESFVIEASSHALEQNRVNQGFDICVFTNLSRDHLDYHQNMQDYFLAKKRLFDSAMLKQGEANFAVINGDDEYGKKLIQSNLPRKVLSFGQEPSNDYQLEILKESLDGCEVKLTLPSKKQITFFNPLMGVHNAYNTVGALVSVSLLGYDMSRVAQHIEKFPGIPGRAQLFKSAQGIYGFVDFAHTPEALQKVLGSLQAMMKKGKIITVFGCGGDRDPGKRAMMGQAARNNSDVVIITSDNPRSEEPQKIIDDILDNQPLSNQQFVEVDRALAIKKAVDMAEPGDVVLIAGKGHENYQILGDKKIEFSDQNHLVASFKA